MAVQQNLREEDLAALRETFDRVIAPTNSEATFKVLKPLTDQDRLNLLESNVDSIELKLSDLSEYIKNIFDGHVLINGQFIKITL